MTIETENDVVALKRIGRIVSHVLQEMLGAAIQRMAKTFGFRIIENVAKSRRATVASDGWALTGVQGKVDRSAISPEHPTPC
jgi:hypothetical protein